MTNERFDRALRRPAAQPEELLTQRDMDLAASIQTVTRGSRAADGTAACAGNRHDNLCLAGGVALNCVANGKILREGPSRTSGSSPRRATPAAPRRRAAAYISSRQTAPARTAIDGMEGSLSRPVSPRTRSRRALYAVGARFDTFDEDELLDAYAEALAEEKAVGWFQGRMEFGPRALGARSILGDPRSPEMQKMLNLKIKYRESFRPFAPSVLREDVDDCFELDGTVPTCCWSRGERPAPDAHDAESSALFGIDKLNVPRSDIPAVTHVDYSARMQTVHTETNPRYHALISAFKARTGCPVLVNTSFNVAASRSSARPRTRSAASWGRDRGPGH